MLHFFRYHTPADWRELEAWANTRQQPAPEVEGAVQSILLEVQNRGDQALVQYTRQFDCPAFRLEQLQAAPDEGARAARQIPEDDRNLILEAAANIRAFHQHQKETSWISHETPGLTLGQLVYPVQRAGVYIPGGRSGETPLVSSLLMNCLPAQVAGVREIVAVTPPAEDGTLNDYILGTAHLLGIETIFAVGSAWAIGALAFGTESIPKVDIISGPGNIYVTTAKRLVLGQVGIDMIAGPSEIVILADATADPRWLAADLLSQAEHDALSSAIVISPEAELLNQVAGEVERQLEQLPRKETARRSLHDHGACIQTADLRSALDVANQLAPEHLQLCIQDPWSALGRIHNAGAVFLGHFSPEPLGDYFAGPNHVLPTLGTARFTSGLSVQHFCKKTNLIAADQHYLTAQAGKISRLARLEGLEAHARSAESRLQPTISESTTKRS